MPHGDLLPIPCYHYSHYSHYWRSPCYHCYHCYHYNTTQHKLQPPRRTILPLYMHTVLVLCSVCKHSLTIALYCSWLLLSPPPHIIQVIGVWAFLILVAAPILRDSAKFSKLFNNRYQYSINNER